jgi:serine/threonine protein phosphatase PrpC
LVRWHFNISDGHGVYGHDVSAYLRETLPFNLNKELNKHKVLSTFDMSKTIKDSFINTNFKLCVDQRIDTNFSGSTCVSVIYTSERLVCANVGDSRAVLGRCVNGGKCRFNI